MACSSAYVGLGLVLILAGCGSGAASDDLDSGTSGMGNVSITVGGAHDVEGGSPGGPPGGTTLDEGGVGSSGGVEDTVFGMSDDMPLVADIPDIKRGELGELTWVRIEQVRPTTGRAELGRDAWFYVQDPTFDQHMGLRVLLQPGEAAPSGARAVDLEGWVQSDAQGWLLELDFAVEGSVQLAVLPKRVRVATLTSADAAVLDDALVEVVEPDALVVTRRGPVPGTVIVGASASTSGALLVDLRPFGVAADLPPGTALASLRGVAEIGGSRPVILPRSDDDIVIGR